MPARSSLSLSLRRALPLLSNVVGRRFDMIIHLRPTLNGFEPGSARFALCRFSSSGSQEGLDHFVVHKFLARAPAGRTGDILRDPLMLIEIIAMTCLWNWSSATASHHAGGKHLLVSE